ncbi:transposase [Streptococcus suis R61]|uniref:Transposase n=1 Tax=Streptococcus suis R61 TaxID=996306 RepID=A0AA87K574_STRSU|nr:transposase [Streptococcus suis R61]
MDKIPISKPVFAFQFPSSGKSLLPADFLYQDEAGVGWISKLGACWSPKKHRPNISSHHIREFRYCYGAVDAHTGESFFIIAGDS